MIALGQSSCSDEKPKPQNFGLNLIEIEMEPEALGELNNSVGAKRPFPARLTIEDETYDVELSYAGKSTLYAFKKSWQVFFKNRTFRGHSEFRISSQKLDQSLVRSLLGFDLFQRNGIEAPESEAIALYVNNKYYGAHILIEPVDLEFFRLRDAPVNLIYKAKFANADFSLDQMSKLDDSFSIKSETKDYSSMMRLYSAVNDKNLSPAQRQQQLEAILDVEQYLRYIAIAVFLNHADGFDNNFFLSRSNIDLKSRMTPWDLDRLYVIDEDYVVNKSIYGRNELTKVLLQIPDFKARYHEILSEIVEQETLEKLIEEVNQRSLRLKEAYTADPILGALNQQEQKERLIANIRTWLAALQSELQSLAP